MLLKPLSNRRILHLEDDYFVATDTEVTLRDAGAHVLLCASVEQALQMLSECDFDAALLDFDVGGMSSVPVARSLRDVNVPFVFLTGHSHEILPEDLSSSALLTKPVAGARVVRELQQQLKASVALGECSERAMTGSR